MSDVFVIVLLMLLLFHYMTFLWSIWSGLSSLSNPVPGPTPFLSVVIAARNEGNHIERCLDALMHQSYEQRSYEVIVVDDHSDDNTTQMVTSLIKPNSFPRITLVPLKDRWGKPEAISHGVAVAQGEVILCTDADCAPPKTWLESMTGCFDPTVAFVAGPVFERASKSLLSRIQAIEYLSLTTTAAGLIGCGKPIICSGASIAYRKSAFSFVDGYGDHTSSCDDETLMQRMVLRNAGRVVFNADPSAIVTTETPRRFSEFWRQRTRWAMKTGRYEDLSILRRLVLVYSFFSVLLVASVCALVDPTLRLPIAMVVLVKVFGEARILFRGAKLFGQRLLVGQFLIAELFHVPYIAIAGLIGQFIRSRWKDRNLQR